jgi:ferredoxin/flavodoxin---NADP+ reductase
VIGKIVMHTVSVTEVKHYSDRLFSFQTNRPKSFRFKNGEFAMIGLPADKCEGKQLFRAYSIVSTCYDDHIEFLSIKVPNGPFTELLQHLQLGDEIVIKPKTVGSLVIDYLKPKQNLVMLSTGTGIAPFMSIIGDHETYDKFENVYLFHTVRNIDELSYIEKIEELVDIFPNLVYINTVTREPYIRSGRFWNYIEDYLPSGFTKSSDAVMVCGSPELNKTCRTLFKSLEWEEGNTGECGDFLLERAFAD